MTFSWDSPIAQKLPAGEAILFFEIKAKQALHLSRVLQLNTGRLRPEVYPADGSIRPFEINFSAAPKISRTEVFPAVPNPSSGPVYIPLALAEAATARLEVFGLNGRQLYKSKHDYPAGLQQLVIPATALSGQGKVLVYRLQVGEQLFCGKLLRL